MNWTFLIAAGCLGLVISTVLSDHLVALVGLGGWCTVGYLGWAWTNFNAYADNLAADENLKKWDMLPIMIIYGPLAPLMTLIIGLVDRNLRFGLRFK